MRIYLVCKGCFNIGMGCWINEHGELEHGVCPDCKGKTISRETKPPIDKLKDQNKGLYRE